MSNDKPFTGLKVLDLSQGYAGPYCTGLLSLYGAEVIKVEPAEGDWGRNLGAQAGGQTGISLNANPGKKSIVLDLKNEQGRALGREMARRADVFVEGFRPGVAARLGFGYDDLQAGNESLIYLAISGFGHAGPYVNRPATDTVLQAFSGLMSINEGDDGVPHKVGHFIIDSVTALYAYQALVTALYARRDDGQGRFIDCSLMQGAAALLAPKLIDYGFRGGPPDIVNAPAGSYRTIDGRIALTVIKDEQFARMARVMGRPEWADDPRYAGFDARAENARELVQAVAKIIAERTTAEWISSFSEADILAQRINDFEDWLADPHVQATAPAKLVEQPGVGEVYLTEIPGVRAIDDDRGNRLAPKLGEHGREVLADLGYSEPEIDGFVTAGALLPPAD
jgi:crotonobetainyl-CoA:carnitine CoA-transferase CaiB-like acyl-CoA transferase